MTAGPRHAGRTAPRLAGALATLAALAALVPLAGPVPAAAQERDRDRERACRCVDAEGREIEECRCIITRRGGVLAPRAPMAPEALAWGMLGARRARLGVTLGSPEGEAPGAPVTDVLEGGPAEAAGLREGDVIVALDGHDLADPVDDEREGHLTIRGNPSVPRLLEVLEELEPGEAVELVYERDGRRVTTTVTPEENPGWGEMRLFGEGAGDMADRMRDLELRLEGGAPRAFMWRGEGDGPRVEVFRRGPGGAMALLGGRCPDGDGGLLEGRSCAAGAELVELNPALGEYFGAEEGVLVPNVEEDSTLGLRPGDVLLAIDGRAVATPDDVRRILGSYEADEAVTLRVLRQRQTMDVRGTVPR